MIVFLKYYNGKSITATYIFLINMLNTEIILYLLCKYVNVSMSFVYRFFGLVGGAANKKTDCKERVRSTGCSSLQGTSSSVLQANQSSSCSSKRRGSDRSLTSSPHELPINSVKVSQSHSQSNLSDIPYR